MNKGFDGNGGSRCGQPEEALKQWLPGAKKCKLFMRVSCPKDTKVRIKDIPLEIK